MNNNSAHQEILLMTGTGFASRQYSERDTIENKQQFSAIEKLKEACWNGLLKEMLPEIFLLNAPQAKLYLWQVREASQFFALEMAEYPEMVNSHWSVDPYRFMEVQGYN